MDIRKLDPPTANALPRGRSKILFHNLKACAQAKKNGFAGADTTGFPVRQRGVPHGADDEHGALEEGSGLPARARHHRKGTEFTSQHI